MDQIIAELAAQRAVCWARRLQGKAAELLAAVEEYEDHGGRLPRQETADKFAVFGAEVTRAQLKHHLNRECACRPK